MTSSNKLIIVGHDDLKHGAQINLLHMIDIMSREFSYDVIVLLLKSSNQLINEYSKITKVYTLTESSTYPLLTTLKLSGYNHAITNTTVCGQLVKILNTVGIKTMSLIHEMPNLIKMYKLNDHCQEINKNASIVVFPSTIVQKGFNSFLQEPLAEQIIKAQGVYKIDINNLPDKGHLRKSLDLSSEDFIVGCTGYADDRKGVKHFIKVCQIVNVHKRVHFVWIGNIHPMLKNFINNSCINTDNLHFLPYQESIVDYVIDFDLFFLSSIEDPFPSSALEAMLVEVPVILFENATGLQVLNEEHDEYLYLTPFADDKKASTKILTLLMNKETLQSRGRKCSELMKINFNYKEYCRFLLNILQI